MPCLGWVPGRLYRPDSRGPRPEPAPVRLLVPAASPALAVACLPRRRSPDTISQRTAAPAYRGEPRQFAALTAREDEVAPRADPLRAIAIRPQVALPASRALLTSASLTDAHLPTVTSHPAVPMVTRPADRPHANAGLVHRVAGRHFDPRPRRPGREARPQQDAPGRLPRQWRAVPGPAAATARHQRFLSRCVIRRSTPAKRAIPPICAPCESAVMGVRGVPELSLCGSEDEGDQDRLSWGAPMPGTPRRLVRCTIFGTPGRPARSAPIRRV